MALGRVGVQIRLADWLFAQRSIGRVLPAESKDAGQLWLWVYPGLTTESLCFAFCWKRSRGRRFLQELPSPSEASRPAEQWPDTQAACGKWCTSA